LEIDGYTIRRSTSQAPWAIGFYRRMRFEIVGKRAFCFGKRVDEDHVMARAV
jgi:hypothetical protein